MSSIQSTINEMYNGNEKIIIDSIQSDKPILLVNAIICGARHKIKKKEFTNYLKKIMDRDDYLMGYSISDMANAAMYIIQEKKYDGNNEYVSQMINSKFDL